MSDISAPQNPALPYSFAKRHGVVLTDADSDEPVLAHLAHTPSLALLEVRRYLNSPISYQEVAEERFNELLKTVYSDGADQASDVVATLSDDLDLSDIAEHLPEPEDLLESSDEAPIIRLINALLAEAVKENASDIHIEPYEDRLAVRLRVDGILREVLQPKPALAPLFISRIKVMARLDIAEKRLPQDGRISLKVGGHAVDVRVSTLPSSHGERVVLRLLDKQAGRLDLEHLGMDQQELDAMHTIIRKPHGIILVTGPTGSGKTTTLYAVLSRLNDRSRNILTVEDPIEYYLNGIGQTQVNSKIDMSFARGLRAILRQDPDVVMVGEIRDRETAEIAVQASLTGHLVLSTLHTNTAIGAVMRLRDMGIEPFLLSSSISGVLSQRLVRRLCPSCKQPYEATASELDLLAQQPTTQAVTLYRPCGCEKCNHLGYKGRSAIFEIVPIDEQLQEMIHDGTGEHKMNDHARSLCKNMRQSARDKVLQGETSVEEIVRVIQDH